MKKSFALLLFFCAIFTLAQERKHTATENVKIISEKFEIPQLKTTRRIWIYLPKDYETSHKKYEVMYLQDAQNLSLLRSSTSKRTIFLQTFCSYGTFF